jgi:hypothetical protein
MTSRAPLMMDVVAAAMLAVVPLLTLSLWLVRSGRRYAAHKRLQLGMAAALALVIGAFEIDVRLHGWETGAADSPYAGTWLYPLLWVHLAIAVSTTLAWIATIAHAVTAMPKPPRPAAASVWHKRLGWVAAGGMYATAVTGWTFYWAAFLAGA